MSRIRPPRRDLGLMVLFLVPSAAQVLLDPITSRPVGLLVAVVSVAPLAWRRTHPFPAALTGSAIWVVPTDGFLYLGYVVAVLLFYSVGAHLRSRMLTLVALSWGCVAGGVGTWLGPEEPVQILGALLVVTAPVIAGRLVAHQRAQNLQLQELTRQLQTERALAQRTAVAEERARIARELHDVVGHEVTLIAVQSEAAASALKTAPERAAEPVEAIRETAHRTMTEMRTILGALNPQDQEEPPAVASGPQGLADLCERARRMGVSNTLSVTGTPWDGPPNVMLALNRVAQESLTNAGRHAPGCTAEVTVDWEPGRVCLQIVTRRPGNAERSTAGGLGIPGMRERVRLCGGELTVNQEADAFLVTAIIPRDQP